MHNGAQSGPNPGEITIIILVVAFVFGIAYNGFVAWLEKSGRDDGYTAFLVVGGVLTTLALAIPLIGLQPVLVVLLLFGCTGLPMIIGSVYRHTETRRIARENLQATLQEFSNGNPG
ncbi:MAG: hypothetical protein KJ063_02565 [Anaerolineae bacterium]|nr:hypothetical protein [Anaerolineae bacterium]